MPITRPLLFCAAVVLWLLLAIIIGVASLSMLRACGISLFGYQLSWCGGPAVSTAVLDRQQGLILELTALQRQYRTLPLCTPAQRLGDASMRPTPAPPAVGPGGTTAPPNPGPGIPNGGSAIPPSPPTGAPRAGGSGSGVLPPEPRAGGTGSPSVGEVAESGSAGNPDSTAPAPGAAPGSGSGSDSPQVERDGGMPNAPPGRSGAASSGNRGGGAGDVSAGQGTDERSSEVADGRGSSCQAGRPQQPGPILLALDHSKSMALPSQMDDRLATELEMRMEENTAAGRQARDLYDSYVDQPGIKRLDVLKDAIARKIDRLPPASTIGLVTFAGCEGVVDAGLFDGNERDALLSRVQSLRPIPATPVADALNAALARARVSGNARVVLVTDGRDTCGGDPCAVARRSNGIKVDVLAIGGGRALSCIAETTGGRLIEAAGATNLDQQIGELLSEDTPSCP